MTMILRTDVLHASPRDLAEPCRRAVAILARHCRAALVPPPAAAAPPADPLLPLVSPLSLGRLCGGFEAEWQAALGFWTRTGRVDIAPAARAIGLRALCAWAGIALAHGEGEHRAADLASDGFLARRRSRDWARSLVLSARAVRCRPAPGSPLALLATGPDPRRAAASLLELLRAAVAVEAAAPMALALHALPGCAGADARADLVAALCRRHPLALRAGSPAEWVAVSLLRRMARLMAEGMEYELPLEQPEGRIVLEGVHRVRSGPAPA